MFQAKHHLLIFYKYRVMLTVNVDNCWPHESALYSMELCHY